MPQLLFSVQSSPTTFITSQASELQTYRHKTEFNAKWTFNIIQGHVFWSQWKGDKGLLLALLVKISTMYYERSAVFLWIPNFLRIAVRCSASHISAGQGYVNRPTVNK